MRVDEFMKKMKEILTENPELKDAQIVYASDDEGNSFHLSHYAPSVGRFENMNWKTESEIEEHNLDFDERLKPNAICVN